MTDNILSDLASHVFLEYFYRPGRMFIREHLIKGTELIFENYGVYKSCEEDAKKIANEISAYPDSKELYVPLFNQFVNIVHIIRNTESDSSSGEYNPEKSKFTGNKFDEIEIRINTGKNTGLGVIMHELTHAYQDYKLRLKGKTLRNELEKSNYFKQTLTVYKDIDEARVVYVLNFLNEFERGAYLSQISGELGSCNIKSFGTVNDIMDFIKNTVTYQNYKDIFTAADKLSEITDKERQNKILTYANKYGRYTFSEYKAFIKWLENKCSKCKHKLSETLPKYICKYLKLDEVLSPNPNKRIDKNIGL